MKKIILILCLVVHSIVFAKAIGFIEDFALSENRQQALKKLIPGTVNYYYYHCLHYLNSSQFDRVDSQLKLWIARHGHSSKVKEIKNRMALLRYDYEPNQSLKYIKKQLNLHFNHYNVKSTTRKLHNRPYKLDQKLISRKSFLNKAVKNRSNISNLEDSALDWYIFEELTARHRRDLLKRLKRPDYQHLVELIVEDLEAKNSRGFGSMEIHRQLLLPQLKELVEAKPELLNQENFVNIYLKKLRPSPDVNIEQSIEEKRQYLLDLWTFVKLLDSAHNSLKAGVLFHLLKLDRSEGMYDEDFFMQYLKLPRQTFYTRSKYLRYKKQHHYVRLNKSLNSLQLTSIGNDEPLVRSYLQFFFEKDRSYKAYSPYIKSNYLKRVFTETMIVNGIGDVEKWASNVKPAVYKKIKERIDLDFSYHNKRYFDADETVNLDVYVKNVNQLIVKIYQINAKNYYKENLQTISTNINLDGLVANHEIINDYKISPERRVKRSFDFPMMNQPGIYVVDFIGNGKSSRALIRKGKLHYLMQSDATGQVFTVYNEKNLALKNASIFLSGREFKADENGKITLPYSNFPTKQNIILVHQNQVTLTSFLQQAENYHFNTGIYVDRESLVKGGKATVVIRSRLLVNQKRIDLSLLKDTTLDIITTNHEGIKQNKQVNIKLMDDAESSYQFSVPDRLSSIRFVVKAKIKKLSKNKNINLKGSARFTINEIDLTKKTQDLFITKQNNQYVLNLLGKTGEAIKYSKISVTFKHKNFKNKINLTMQTNEEGQLFLGQLRDIESVVAQSPKTHRHIWSLNNKKTNFTTTLITHVGDSINVPYLGSNHRTKLAELSLLEKNNGVFIRDYFHKMKIKDGMIVVSALPKGDYELYLKPQNKTIAIKVITGKQDADAILGAYRQARKMNAKPVNIKYINRNDKEIKIYLKNATQQTRVHVFSTHYLPSFSMFDHLVFPLMDAMPSFINKATTNYVTGRIIGDEYRYIIERKYLKKYPGNLLKKPELLLNPWVLKKTKNSRQFVKTGNEFDAIMPQENKLSAVNSYRVNNDLSSTDFSNVDFLNYKNKQILNLRADKNGVVSISRELLNKKQQLHIVVVEKDELVYQSAELNDIQPVVNKDLRLINNLSPKKHFAEQKKIQPVKVDETIKLDDITTGKIEVVDSLKKVYRLFSSLNNNQNLKKFRFILQWDQLSKQKKMELFSEHACHELSFFIYKKDRPFFNEVIKSYLLNKKHKTFMDHWLLDNNLAEYTKAWQFGRLNIVEKILLNQRLTKKMSIQRFVRESNELIPPNIDHFNRLFNTAISSAELDVDNLFLQHKNKLLNKVYSPSVHQSSNLGSGIGFAGMKDDISEETMAPLMESTAGFKGKRKMSQMHQSRSMKQERSRAKRSLSTKKRRDKMRQYYRQAPKTQEYAENNYYHLPIEQQLASLIKVNGFWNDYAKFIPQGGQFLSTEVASASTNFTEMMFALSVIDLPFESQVQKPVFSGSSMSFKSKVPATVYLQEIVTTKKIENSQIMVNQQFFQQGDRYRYKNNQRQEKFINKEFLTDTVYGALIVVTNPSSLRQKIDLLLQIPKGAMPVKKSFVTHTLAVNLSPYSTKTVEYYFYFPKTGVYDHFPVHISKNGQVIANAKPFVFNVVNELKIIDKSSWNYISQYGSLRQVLQFLADNNLQRLDLSKIAYLLRKKKTYRKIIGFLKQQHIYHDVVWSYSVLHNDIDAMQQYLKHQKRLVKKSGLTLESRILNINPVQRNAYQYLEYSPLINARQHPLGKSAEILNNRLYGQYHQWLKMMSYRTSLSPDDLMTGTYYLLSQDRMTEALKLFSKVKQEKLTTQLQYDYFKAYFAMTLENVKEAESIAKQYLQYPVVKWRNRFMQILAQVNELNGAEVTVTTNKSRLENQTKLASTEPSLEFSVDAGSLLIDYQNINEIQINYYLIDLELMFSKKPFSVKDGLAFSYIKANHTQTVSLPKGPHYKTGLSSTSTQTKLMPLRYKIKLPDQFSRSNLMIEISSGGLQKNITHYAHALHLKMIENYGQLKINDEQGKPVSKAYIKVYAKLKNGQQRFYKDGYSDLRGRFDYASLSTNELDSVEKFSILVISQKSGAFVKEVRPPKQ